MHQEERISGRRVRRRAMADCRNQKHRYGSAQEIGGGILRRVCVVCGAVSIDLTAVEDPLAVGLFGERADFPDEA